ncbi:MULTISPECIES: glucose 1-dehydrogenase [Pontibacter]|uniref:Alcohol dehydrogenase n=1 Tax=Pontibacter actiniarum TaxID=323450 RepID=A0A1X9YYU2_9BACT|nr:glucose 1-dehydrogenase [Pontibacter actiniarum]ARS38058.1 alcohol dehydrogenase [Pontibacter actiniarum]MDX5421284.1 glucose 1-dehydrogenase [Hymenobacteraceae bacterium]
MKALSLTPHSWQLDLIDVPEPRIVFPNQVKLSVLEVGICGTDREQVVQKNVEEPAGPQGLVIGHEMLGQVVEIGTEVRSVRVGDLAVVTVRRGCGLCKPCRNNRSDMCYTGLYKERGIKGLNGYETEYVVEEELYVVKVPESIRELGVLTEPMSVAEKAIDEAQNVQAARLPEVAGEGWLAGKKTLVAGLGPIGLLAAVALRLRGAEVIGMDIVDETTKRPLILKELGGQYLDGRKVSALEIDERYGQVDFIFEATGIAKLGFELIDALGVNGIYVMTGIPHGDRPVCILGAELIKQMVLKNQIILGSVNAGIQHFELAIEDLQRAKQRWGNLTTNIITTRVSYQQFSSALNFRSVDDIKTVIEWNGTD